MENRTGKLRKYGKAVNEMEFLKALLTEGLQFIVMAGVAFGAVLLGIMLRKRKNAAKEEE